MELSRVKSSSRDRTPVPTLHFSLGLQYKTLSFGRRHLGAIDALRPVARELCRSGFVVVLLVRLY